MAAQKVLNKRRVTFYMSGELKRRLEDEADATGLKQSYIVEQALAAHLGKRKPLVFGEYVPPGAFEKAGTKKRGKGGE